MNKDDKKIMEDAYIRLLERANIQAGDEPHLIFGMLAVENEMMLQHIELLKQTHRAFVEHVNKRLPNLRLVIPEAGFKVTQ
jgi:hypothetical protein